VCLRAVGDLIWEVAVGVEADKPKLKRNWDPFQNPLANEELER
jgi:hypothetical protein